MRWEARWWGITFTAENLEDAELLKELESRLPKKLEFGNYYDDGEMKKVTNINTKEYQLVFRR